MKRLFLITLLLFFLAGGVFASHAQQDGEDCDAAAVRRWVEARQTWRQTSQDVLDAQGVTVQSALAQLADHLQQIENLPRPACADEAMLWTYYLYTRWQHLLICALVGDTSCSADVQQQLADYRARDDQLMAALVSGAGLPDEVLHPPTPTRAPTAVMGSRSNPVPLRTSYTFPGIGTLTVQESRWRAGSTGLAIVYLSFTCERPADQTCNTTDFMLDAVGESGATYAREFDISVPEPWFGNFMNSDVYGGGTATGYAAFLVTAQETGLLMRAQLFLKQEKVLFVIS